MKEKAESIPIPKWSFQNYSLGNCLRECIWSLERVDTQFTMIRHSWSTPCFTPVEDDILLPCPEDDDAEDDINGPLFIGMLRNKTNCFVDPQNSPQSPTSEDGISFSQNQVSSAKAIPQIKGASMSPSSLSPSSPVRNPSSSRLSVVYKTRKTSMPLPLGIPEDREASCDSDYLSPFGSPPTIFISSSPRLKVSYITACFFYI